MSEEQTYYEVLQINPDATQAEIRKAYLKLCVKYHPDKNPHNVRQCQEIFVEVSEAYEILSDEDERRRYDYELAHRGGGGTTNSTANNGAAHSNYNYHDNSSTVRPKRKKSYATYREAFDHHVSGMTDDELRFAMGASAVVGGLIGSLVGAHYAEKLPGGSSKLGRSVLGNVGSLVGSMMGSDAGQNLVRSTVEQSRENITYEERKRMARERGEPMPERPKSGIERFRESVESALNANDSGDGDKNSSNNRKKKWQDIGMNVMKNMSGTAEGYARQRRGG